MGSHKRQLFNQMRTQPYIFIAVVLSLAWANGMTSVPSWSLPFSTASRVNTVLTSRDGLPQDTVKSVLQTRDGYVWTATQDGVARFDGTEFTVFDTRDCPGLATNNINQLLEDSSGDLWAAGYGGVSRIRGVSATDFTPTEEINTGNLVSLKLDVKGRVWALQDGRIYRFDGNKLQLVTDTRDYLNGDSLSAWALDTDGSIDIGTVRGAVIQIRHGQAHHFRVDQSLNGSAAVNSLLSYPSETVWVGTNKGLFVLSHDQLLPFGNPHSVGVPTEVVQDHARTIWVLCGQNLYSIAKGKLVPADDLKGIPVASISINTGGELVCLYGNNGVDHSTYSNFVVNTGTLFIGEKGTDGLSGFVRCAIRDREGNLWVGTDRGLNCIRDRDCHTFTLADGLPSLPIRSIFSDLGGHIFVSSENSGLYSYSFGASGKFSPVATGIKSITSVVETEQGQVLILSNHKVYQRFGSQVRNVDKQYGIAQSEIVTSMFDSNHGDTWFATLNRFIHKGDAGLSEVKIPGAGVWTYNCSVDRIGRFWASTSRGLYCVDSTGLHLYGPKDGVSGVIITSIYMDSSGTMWFGHWGGGLTRFKDGKFGQIGVRQGLYSDGDYQITEDAKRNLWIGSSKGIFEVSLAELNDAIDGKIASVHCFPYGPADGASGAQCFTDGSAPCIMPGDGTLWFSGLRGLVRIDPDNIVVSPSPVLIERAFIEGKNYTGMNSVKVQPGNGSVQFQFAALDYRDPGHLHFQYRLDGFDTAWTETDNARYASYTNLPPGHYRFVVKVTNSDSLWSNSTSMEFTLRPRYYQTWLFKILVVVLSLSLVIGYASFRIQRLRRHNNMLQRLTDQLEDQNDELVASQNEVMAAQHALEEANARLFAQASTDALTGITNRRIFIENLDEEWRVGNNVGAPLSLLMIDVDNFKTYNDTFGHPAGDEVLRNVAKILQASARGSDVVARYGGEEFVVILRNTNEHIAATVAERFRQSISKGDWTKRPITVSIGAATRTDAQASPSALISSADIALYHSKEHGRNRVTHYSDLQDNENDMAA